jgi:hypothetical protein
LQVLECSGLKLDFVGHSHAPTGLW